MTITLDMDNVLARFPDKHGEKGTQMYKKVAGFFKNLLPFAGIEELNEICGKSNIPIMVLSNSPNEQADLDKNAWLDEHLPNVKKRVFNRGHLTADKTKAELAAEVFNRQLRKDDMLIDDSPNNLFMWEQAGGTGILKRHYVKDTWHTTFYRLSQVTKYIKERNGFCA